MLIPQNIPSAVCPILNLETNQFDSTPPDQYILLSRLLYNRRTGIRSQTLVTGTRRAQAR